MKRLTPYAIACLGFLLSSAAHAVDGVLELNHASILAAGGYPAVIGAPGSYVLTGNLTPPGGSDAIAVVGNNVTLDLNGFTIDGAGVGVNGIFAPLVLGLTVRNGVVTGFSGTGIAAGASSKTFQVKVNGNGTGIGSATGCLIVESVVESNAGRGIEATECKVENNVIANNGVGITGNTNVIVHNVIRANTGGGITGEGCTIQQNVVTLNSVFGITDGFLGPGLPPPIPQPGLERTNIVGNTIESNLGPGVTLGRPGVVADNTVSSNAGNGILCGPGCVVRGNTVTLNNQTSAPASGGIVVGAGANVSENSIFLNNGFGLNLPVTAAYSQNTLLNNGPVNVVAIPAGAHPTSGFMNLCNGVVGPAPTCP